MGNSSTTNTFNPTISVYYPVTSTSEFSTVCQAHPSSSECELVQSKIQTQYYIQYTLDICIFAVLALTFIKVLTWKNWASGIISK